MKALTLRGLVKQEIEKLEGDAFCYQQAYETNQFLGFSTQAERHRDNFLLSMALLSWYYDMLDNLDWCADSLGSIGTILEDFV